MNQLRKKINWMHVISYSILYVILFLIALMIIYPYLYMLFTSFKTSQEVIDNAEVYLFPKSFTLLAYFGDSMYSVLEIIPYFRGFANTMIVEGAFLTFGVLSSFSAAYAFSKMHFAGKNFFFITIVSSMMIPFVVTLMPLYSVYSKLYLTNTFWPLVIPHLCGNAGMMFFVKQYLDGVPTELVEAGKIDGMSSFRICWQVIFPLALPAVATQVVFVFLSIWNDVLGPDLYLEEVDKKTLQVLLRYLMNTGGGMKLSNQPVAMAGSVLASLPVLLLYGFCQKYFVGAISASGVKG